MAIEVILDIFSGRENPRWVLAADQEREALEKIDQVQTPTLMKPSGVVGKSWLSRFYSKKTQRLCAGWNTTHRTRRHY